MKPTRTLTRRRRCGAATPTRPRSPGAARRRRCDRRETASTRLRRRARRSGTHPSATGHDDCRQERRTLHVQRHDAARSRCARARGGHRRRRICIRRCARRISARSRMLRRGDMIVACTQEQRLLGEVAEEAGACATIRFVNIRETAGWSAEAPRATPKIAALLAAAALPDPEPVPSVGYKSEGQVLIVGPLDVGAALGRGAARRRCPSPCSRRRRHARRSLPADARVSGRFGPAHAARRVARRVRRAVVAGKSDRPRRLHALQRLRYRVPGACDRRGISRSISIACKDHRACVAACGAIGAIDFDRRETARGARFDAVLDLQPRGGSRSTSRRRVISRRARIRSRRRKPPRNSRCRSANSRSRNISRTSRRSARTAARGRPVAPNASTCARRWRSAPTATTSRSSRTCAWAAAPARPSARRVR